MYGNTQFGADAENVTITPDQRRTLRRDLASVTDRMRDLLPGEFAVGSELTEGSSGPRATVAVQPPLGPAVSANYDLEGEGEDLEITDEEREELVLGLAASAALQMKQATGDDSHAVAR